MSVNVQRLLGRSPSSAATERGGTAGTGAAKAAQAGFLAALLMIVAQLAWRLIDDAPVPAFPELVVAAVARLTPVDVFGEVTETYGSLAKKTLFVTVLVAIAAVGAWAGGLAGRLTARTGTGIGGRLTAGALVAGGLFLVAGLVVMPIGYYGPFAVDSARTGAILTQVAVTFALFAAAWAVLAGLPATVAAPAGAAAGETSRRAVVVRGAEAVLTLGALSTAGALTWRILNPRSTVDEAESDLAAQQIAEQARATGAALATGDGGAGADAAGAAAQPTATTAVAEPSPTAAPPEPTSVAAIEPTEAAGAAASPEIAGQASDATALFAELDVTGKPKPTPVITSVADFYHVSKNIVDPEVSADGWTLKITGMVDRPLTLTHQELVDRATTRKITTLCCISNELNGDLIGTAEWQGIPLAELLAEAGVQEGVYKAKFRCADDYEDSILLERALDPDTLVVTGMNGELLTPDHGFPARLIVPGIYGMKNVKWVEEIELTDEDFKGYWQTRGWSDPAPYQIWGRIDFPRGGTIPAGPTTAYGVASAGDRGVSRVEVSLDEGTTWADALLEPAINPPFTWVRWAFPFEAVAGKQTLIIRATDGNGEVADPTPRSPLPDGATGWPKRTFKVE